MRLGGVGADKEKEKMGSYSYIHIVQAVETESESVMVVKGECRYRGGCGFWKLSSWFPAHH